MITVMTRKPSHNREIDHEIGIDGECPICAKLRDPVTGNPPFNAKARAAMEESRAMARGELPANWRKPHELEEALKELLED